MADEKAATAATGKHGLNDAAETVLRKCVSLFGNSSFTVSMYCLKSGASAPDCLKVFRTLHECGCFRKPDNDGGQELYQVMPGIVRPKGDDNQ